MCMDCWDPVLFDKDEPPAPPVDDTDDGGNLQEILPQLSSHK